MLSPRTTPSLMRWELRLQAEPLILDLACQDIG